MKFGAWKSAVTLVPLLLFALTACAPGVALSQESPSETPVTTRKERPASDSIKLSDATRVSTDEAARGAAKERSKDDKGTKAKSQDGAGTTDQENVASSPVTELQPSVKAKDDKSAAGSEPASGRDRKPSKIHGSVSGATGSEARASDAEISAGSKSGKTHVYVEAGRTETPQPH